MSNAGRPSLQRKTSKKSEANRKEQLDYGISIRVDGVDYTVREGDLTSLDTMALRRETGMTFVSLGQAFMESPDIDLIAALVWLARRIDGEHGLPFAVVASEITYDSEVDVIDDDPGEEKDPEA